jgi:hypothetical protein
MEKRMTGKDYRKVYKELKKEQESLSAHIKHRLIELSKTFPDAIISYKPVPIRAKCIVPIYVEGLDIEKQIEYIEAIEEWSRRLEGVRQSEIEM